MTKQVRIENADGGTDKILIVEVWENYPGSLEPNKLISTVELKHPTHLESFFVWENRYLLVKEKKKDENT